ncbi:hypothetical protein C8R47DRAFT_1224130 [Mycena vitilis]|nr:hypothetical protein C8R47DRAFT_1224130 [Mycena vitilis]
MSTDDVPMTPAGPSSAFTAPASVKAYCLLFRMLQARYNGKNQSSSVAGKKRSREDASEQDDVPSVVSRRSNDREARVKRKGASHRRTRVPAPELTPSNMSRQLPVKVPIDYFSPEFFNDLSVKERASYMGNGVALPTAELCQSWATISQWKGLGQEEFMAKYGDAKLALYNLPTPAELEMLRD